MTIEKTSAKSVLAALAANAFVATLKLVAFLLQFSPMSDQVRELEEAGLLHSRLSVLQIINHADGVLRRYGISAFAIGALLRNKDATNVRLRLFGVRQIEGGGVTRDEHLCVRAGRDHRKAFRLRVSSAEIQRVLGLLEA
ncbi:MAG: hypothetical protein J0I07_17925, partial [Myxococcales bacterium]|nr:hypothetical protein [Myxococcales bacterium]